MGAWKFLTADTQGIKRIGAIGTPFKPVLLRFRQLLTPFVLAPIVHTCRLDGYQQIFIILLVKERYKIRLSGQHAVNQQIFLNVTHRLAYMHFIHLPATLAELMRNNPPEILIIDCIIGTQCRTVIVKHHLLTLVMPVISTKIIHQFRQLTFVLYKEGLEHSQLAPCGCPATSQLIFAL